MIFQDIIVLLQFWDFFHICKPFVSQKVFYMIMMGQSVTKAFGGGNYNAWKKKYIKLKSNIIKIQCYILESNQKENCDVYCCI